MKRLKATIAKWLDWWASGLPTEAEARELKKKQKRKILRRKILRRRYR
jgi:hypothetical protein